MKLFLCHLFSKVHVTEKMGENNSHWSHCLITRAYFTRVSRQLVTYTMWWKNSWSQIIFVLLIEITQSKNHVSNALWFIHFLFEILHTTWKDFFTFKLPISMDLENNFSQINCDLQSWLRWVGRSDSSWRWVDWARQLHWSQRRLQTLGDR